MDYNDLDDITKDEYIIRVEAWQMVNLEDEFTGYGELTHGYRLPLYDKCMMFRPRLKEINYEIGAHKCNPVPTVKKSDRNYKMYHYKVIDPDKEPCPTVKKWMKEEERKNFLSVVKLK